MSSNVKQANKSALIKLVRSLAINGWLPVSAVCSLSGRLTQESMYVQEKIAACPYNASSWNYLRGLLSLPGTNKALVLEDLPAFCLKVSAAMPVMIALFLVLLHFPNLVISSVRERLPSV